jgi:hypothetical protein
MHCEKSICPSTCQKVCWLWRLDPGCSRGQSQQDYLEDLVHGHPAPDSAAGPGMWQRPARMSYRCDLLPFDPKTLLHAGKGFGLKWGGGAGAWESPQKGVPGKPARSPALPILNLQGQQIHLFIYFHPEERLQKSEHFIIVLKPICLLGLFVCLFVF